MIILKIPLDRRLFLSHDTVQYLYYAFYNLDISTIEEQFENLTKLVDCLITHLVIMASLVRQYSNEESSQTIQW